MRELKFRAWDKKYSTMVRELTGFVEDLNKKRTRLFLMDATQKDGMGTYVGDSERFIIEQYTGFKDKNGVEIYEGDILNSQNDGKNGCDVWGYSDFKDIIVEWNAGFGVVKHNLEEENSVHHQSYIEVIGNIHEV